MLKIYMYKGDLGMMINKRLINTVKESKKFIFLNILAQWIGLLANIVLMICVANLFMLVYSDRFSQRMLLIHAIIVFFALAIKFVMICLSNRFSYLSSKSVKKKLRELIYLKLLKLGMSYREKIKTSEIVQVFVEGVDQLETYFGAYLPQFFYAMIAPLTLFALISTFNLPSAIVLLVCVPLIPVAIALVQTWAKKLLSKYWGQYTALGDTFLENLQGLTTLKIYQSDKFKQDKMDEEAESFRKITMKVLKMQLNSITIMDLVAYGGAAAGIIMAITQLAKGNIELHGCALIILLSAEFFLPMRQLGSFFHIAMNGMAASDKIFKLLDLEEDKHGIENNPSIGTISCTDLSFSYVKEREILHGISMCCPQGSFTSIVGKSGCGKSTIASLLMGRNKGYTGSIKIGNAELADISEKAIMQNITYVSTKSYLFKGTVRDNLLMGNPNASDDDMWNALKYASLDSFLRNEKGLDTAVEEEASNLSGGQAQRLALARALLHDSPVYIFDEATSNIDVESENIMMEQIYRLSHTKTIILISHRLANVVKSDCIYVISDGSMVDMGTHEELLQREGKYRELWNAQQGLENYTEEVNTNE